MAFSSASSSSISSEINVTPLIDVLLVLLIIFMVIVPVLPRGLDSSIPQDSHTPAVTQGPAVVRVLAQSGTLHYRLDEHEMEFTELRPALAQIFATRQDHGLLVEADRTLDYGQVAKVLGEARAAGAGAVALLGPDTR